MNGSLLGTLTLGFVLGLKHALDADHLVAVSTIVGREKSVWKSAIVGVVWGMGHTASLFLAAVAVILLRLTISARTAATMEFAVGLMLIILGLDLVRRVIKGEISIHAHRHPEGETTHAHLHVHADVLAAPDGSHHAVGKRPFFVGLVHGMAGSAALMLFVLTTITNPWLGVLYVVIFGAGTIGGMLVMSAILGLPFALANRVFAGLVGKIQFAAGLGSLGFGVFYAWHVAVAGGLFPRP